MALAALWLPLLVRLSQAWRAEPDQAYGWAVPLLALYLAWERWQTSPAPREPSSIGRVASWLLLGGAWLILAPLLAVLEANPLWPTAQWMGAGTAVAATLAGMVLLGGGRWAAHFIFPAGFILTALTWPAMVRGGLFGLLAPFNAGVAAELVSAGGHPAVATGNVIEVAGGLVGVDEACSGLRSVQAAVMLGWFFGEFYLLGAARRIALVLGALGLALVGNLARTTFLAWQAASHGLAAEERWHDLAGGVVLLVVLAGTAAMAARLARGRTPPVMRASAAPVIRCGGVAVLWAVLAGGVIAETAARGWYVWRDHRHGIERVRWVLNAQHEGWRPVTLPKASQVMLRCTHIQGLAHGRDAGTADALAYVLRWEGDVTLTGEWHTPSVCLPAAGVRLAGEMPPLVLTPAGVPVSFEHYRFKAGEQVQHVFFARWDEREARSFDEGHSFISDVTGYRLRRVLEGRRRADVEQITFVVLSGTAAEAEHWARTTIPQLLRRAE
ncbi:MAG: exosortase/archaeosortase family protein [Opitutaceae bacterium]|jgi:exosortase